LGRSLPCAANWLMPAIRAGVGCPEAILCDQSTRHHSRLAGAAAHPLQPKRTGAVFRATMIPLASLAGAILELNQKDGVGPDPVAALYGERRAAARGGSGRPRAPRPLPLATRIEPQAPVAARRSRRCLPPAAAGSPWPDRARHDAPRAPRPPGRHSLFVY
jgi:hypothetical protein